MEWLVLVGKAVGEADGSGRGAGVVNIGFGWFLTKGISEGEGGGIFLGLLGLDNWSSIGRSGWNGNWNNNWRHSSWEGGWKGTGSKTGVGTTPVGYKEGGTLVGNRAGRLKRTIWPTMGRGTGAKRGAKLGSIGITPLPSICVVSCVRTSKSKWAALELKKSRPARMGLQHSSAKLNQAIRTAAMHAIIIMHFGLSSRILKASQPHSLTAIWVLLLCPFLSSMLLQTKPIWVTQLLLDCLPAAQQQVISATTHTISNRSVVGAAPTCILEPTCLFVQMNALSFNQTGWFSRSIDLNDTIS
jgi:hypothetical protein